MLGNMLVGLVLVVFAVIISFSAVKWFPEPYLWIFLTWASVFLCALRLVPRARTAWISLVILSCVLAGLEGFFWISGIWIYKDVKSEGTFKWVSDNVLGFVAPKGVARTEAKYYRGEKLFDVVYTMDANGLRITYARPPSTKTNRPCVLFFGDSYTFGWGLNDQETMPYRVATRTGEKFRVYNLAFPTHGAHQMLAALDHGLVGKEVDCAPQDINYIIYVATPDHVRRAAGLREIDFRHGPRYVLGADGNVSYQGQFGEDGTKMEKIGIQLAKSSLYRKLVGGDAIYTRRYNGADVTLYLAIVGAARTQIKNAYPNAEFHVLAWSNDAKDKDKALASQIIKGFSDKGFAVHRVEDILPGSSDNKAEYFLGGWDLHPNAMADDRIAQFVVRDILKQ
jgi:hypothetical protein